jgi:hypothetical protein
MTTDGEAGRRRRTMGFGPYQVGTEVRAGLVQLAGRGPKAVQYVEVDGRPTFEGDIVLKYFIEIRNLTNGPVDIEARYAVLNS